MAEKNYEAKIMVFGTFDGVHKGHLNFFKQARNLVKKNLKSFVVVSVARDRNVKKIKGSYPIWSEKKRVIELKKIIKKTKLADKIVLGGLSYHLPHILKENVREFGPISGHIVFGQNCANN